MRLDLPSRFAGIRVVGDVHGEAAPFRAAVEGARAERLFVLQLGDLTDYGPDSPGVLALMLELLEHGEGVALLGNHDHKLARALAGRPVQVEPEGLGRTLAQLAVRPDREDLVARTLQALGRAPLWLLWRDCLFVHGGFHTDMLTRPSPVGAEVGRPDALAARALFGETVRGEADARGFPIRRIDWVHRIPPGLTVYCGHDNRGMPDRPYVIDGCRGGRAVFLDTGAGKGGVLTWLDLAA
ncbi:MAG: metallophosphoesterase [Elioraea sp.]|nr:metallophosphoesterase [Elioraea sp.]MDW8443697.1 metallophosphoesterase [Acetobacteraceae bacterium]